TCNIEVTPILAESISLNTNEITLTISNEQQLIATVLPLETTDKTVTWNSLEPLIATVDNTGKVTAHAEGQTTIVATTTNGLVAECIIHVDLLIIPVDEVIVSEESLSLFSNETGSLTATVLPEDASNKTIVWSSEDVGIATVSQSGVITPSGIGTTRIIATASNGKADTCFVNITPTPLTGISLTQTSISLNQGQSYNLSNILTLEPIEAETSSIVWASTSSSVHISSEGIITNKLDFGSETITVTV